MSPVADPSPTGLVLVTMPEEAIREFERTHPRLEFCRIPVGDNELPEYILRVKGGLLPVPEGGGS